MYIDCCKIQILIQFLNIFNTYKTNVNTDNGYIYYAIIKCKFYEFKNNFKYYNKHLSFDKNFKVKS